MTRTEGTAPSSPTVEIVDSGRYRVYSEPLSEPVYHPIPEPPAEPPFLAIFIPTNLELETQDNRFLWKLEQKVVKRLCVHFGRPVMVATDGQIIFDEQPQTQASQAIILRIDLKSHLTLSCAMRLPKDRSEPIKELRTQFPLDPWKLCVVREEDPKWHDHIFFVDGKFVLGSVLRKARPELFQ